MKLQVELSWKNYNVNLDKVCESLRTAVDPAIGLSAAGTLQVWGPEDMTEEHVADIQAYWDSISETSVETTSYKSFDDIKADIATKKASGKAKLLALGLTEDEVSAILG